MLNRLKNQKEVQRFKKSNIILRRLFALEKFKKAKTVLFYASFSGEVETHKMIKEALNKGKVVALPFISKNKKRMTARAIRNLSNSLARGPFGALQPRENRSRSIAKTKLDFVAVPGLAFDQKGCRLGRGKGFYDRFLSNLSLKSYTVGLCFDFQIVSSVPHSSKDLAVKQVISA